MFKDELNQEIGKEINVQRDDTNPNNVFIIEGPHITFSVDPEFESSKMCIRDRFQAGHQSFFQRYHPHC